MAFKIKPKSSPLSSLIITLHTENMQFCYLFSLVSGKVWGLKKNLCMYLIFSKIKGQGGGVAGVIVKDYLRPHSVKKKKKSMDSIYQVSK